MSVLKTRKETLEVRLLRDATILGYMLAQHVELLMRLVDEKVTDDDYDEEARALCVQTAIRLVKGTLEPDAEVPT
jgi:hypothetical protein